MLLPLLLWAQRELRRRRFTLAAPAASSHNCSPPHPPAPALQVETKVLAFSELDAAAGVTRWKLADVRANRQSGGKGRGLNRKQRDAVYELPLAVLRRVNLHVDF